MTDDFTSPTGVLKFISPFWTSQFPDRGFINGIADYHAAVTKQLYQDTLETINLVSIDSAPVFHTELLYPLILDESQMSVGPLPINYGAGAFYGEQPDGGKFAEGEIFLFGGKEKRSDFFYFGVPKNLKGIGSTIVSGLVEPEVIMVRDTDFILLDGILAFSSNPFLNPSIKKAKKLGGDRIVLWGTNALVDKNFVSDVYTAPFNSTRESSEDLISFARSLYSLYCGGPSILNLDSFVAACAGQPVVKRECVVEKVTSFGGNTLVITDKDVYKFSSSFPIRDEIVSGVTLKKGSPLTKITRVDDLISDPGWWKTEAGITLDRGLQAPGAFKGALFFANKDGFVFPHETESGISARFEIFGSDEAKASFWSYVDNNSTGKSLGEELWKEEGLEGPFDSNLHFNPMQFLVEKVFMQSMVAIRVDATMIPSMEKFLLNLRHLRMASTPISLLVFFIDYTTSEAYSLNASETTSKGHTKGIPRETIDPASFASESFILTRASKQLK